VKDVNKKKRIDVKRMKNASHTYPHLAHSNMQCVRVGRDTLFVNSLDVFSVQFQKLWRRENSECFDLRTRKHILHTHVRTNTYFRKREESVSEARFSRKRLKGVL